MDIRTVYYIVISCLVLVGSAVILKNRKWGLLILGASLLIHRYNIYFPTVNRSIQISFIFIIVFLIRHVLLDPDFLRRLRNILKGKIKLWQDRSMLFLALMSGLIILESVTLIYSYDRIQGLFDIAFRMLAFGAAFAIYWSLKRQPSDLKYFSAGIIFMGMADVILSLFQFNDCITNNCEYFNHLDKDVLGSKGLALTMQMLRFGDIWVNRAMGMLGDVNMHGFIMLAISSLTLYWIIRKPKVRGYLIPCYLAFIAIGLLTFSRSAIGSYIAVICTWLSFCYGNFMLSKANRKKKIRVSAFIFIVITAIAAISYFMYLKPHIKPYLDELVMNRFVLETDSSAQKHFSLIQEAWQIGSKDSNFMGTGVGSFPKYYYEHYDPNVVDQDPHSWIFRIFAEEGILGVAAYIGFILWYCFKIPEYIRSKPKKGMATSLLLAIIPLHFASGMIFYYGLLTPMFWVWFGVGYAVITEPEKFKLQELEFKFRYIPIAFMRVYQKLFSFDHAFWANPTRFRVCIYQPSCSEYMITALKKYGIIRGGWMGIKRLARCTPFHEPKYDPVT